ncbi:MAG TPA: hypothetical protein VIJ27_13985 [Mucilaginibacter sp.]
MNLTPIKKLDLVLGIVAEETNNTSIATIVLKGKEKVSGSDVHFVLDKLVEDKYVHFIGGPLPANVTENTAFSYSITFNGLVFHQQGGYSREHKNRRAKARKDAAYTIVVAVGTFLAGLYTLFEIVKWVFHHFHRHLPF